MPLEEPLERKLKDLADQIPVRNATGETRTALWELQQELRAGGSRLAGKDLVAAYPPRELLADDVTRLHRFADLLATARDVLVFVPIMLTWAFLGKAVASWTSSTTDLSFLAYWQSAPKGSHITSVSDAAHYVLWTLIGVSALIFLVQLIDFAADRRGSREAHRQKLTAALARATLLLAVPMTPSKVSAADLNTVTGRIHDTVRRLETSLQPMSKSLTGLGASLGEVFKDNPTAAVEQAVARMETALGEWRRSAEALSGLGETLKAPTETLNEFTKLQKSVHDDQQRLRAALHDLIARLESSTEHSAQEAQALGQVAGSARETLDRFAASLDLFTDHGDSVRALVYQLQELMRKLDDDARHGPDGPVRDNLPPAFTRGEAPR